MTEPAARTRPGLIGRSPFASAGQLALVHLRTTWKRLLGWTVALAGTVVVTGASISTLYPDPPARATYRESVGLSPAVAAFNGRGFDLDTVGGITAYEVGVLGQLLFPLVIAYLAIRMTRREEDSGRMELIRSGVVGRLAPIAAAITVLALVTAGVVVLIGAGLSALDMPTGGAWGYALSLGLMGFAFGMVALVVAEVSNDARTALGLSMLIVLVAYLLRAVIDGRGWSLVWLSPLGWLAEARPWGDTQMWPYVAFVAMALIAALAAEWITLHRDVGSGLIGIGAGPARGRAALGSPLGFAWRFTRAPFLGWLIALVVLGAALGSLSSEMTDLIEQNPAISELLRIDRPEQLITVTAVLLSALGAAGLGTQGMIRLAREEEAGRIALVLSRTVNRPRLWLAWVGMVAAQATVTLFASSFVVGAATWAATGEASVFGPTLSAGAALLAAVLFVIALAAAIQAFAPKLAAVAWVPVGWAVVVGLLGGALDLPEWASSLSPLYAVGNVPLEPPSATAIGVLSVLGFALLAGGAWRFGRRDLLAG